MTKTTKKNLWITKEERLHNLLKIILSSSWNSKQKITDEIWITEPTLRDFLAWKATKKTEKLVERWCYSHVNFLSDCRTNYRRIQNDDE